MNHDGVESYVRKDYISSTPQQNEDKFIEEEKNYNEQEPTTTYSQNTASEEESKTFSANSLGDDHGRILDFRLDKT